MSKVSKSDNKIKFVLIPNLWRSDQNAARNKKRALLNNAQQRPPPRYHSSTSEEESEVDEFEKFIKSAPASEGISKEQREQMRRLWCTPCPGDSSFESSPQLLKPTRRLPKPWANYGRPKSVKPRAAASRKTSKLSAKNVDQPIFTCNDVVGDDLLDNNENRPPSSVIELNDTLKKLRITSTANPNGNQLITSTPMTNRLSPTWNRPLLSMSPCSPLPAYHNGSILSLAESLGSAILVDTDEIIPKNPKALDNDLNHSKSDDNTKNKDPPGTKLFAQSNIEFNTPNHELNRNSYLNRSSIKSSGFLHTQQHLLSKSNGKSKRATNETETSAYPVADDDDSIDLLKQSSILVPDASNPTKKDSNLYGIISHHSADQPSHSVLVCISDNSKPTLNDTNIGDRSVNIDKRHTASVDNTKKSLRISITRRDPSVDSDLDESLLPICNLSTPKACDHGDPTLNGSNIIEESKNVSNLNPYNRHTRSNIVETTKNSDLPTTADPLYSSDDSDLDNESRLSNCNASTPKASVQVDQPRSSLNTSKLSLNESDTNIQSCQQRNDSMSQDRSQSSGSVANVVPIIVLNDDDDASLNTSHDILIASNHSSTSIASLDASVLSQTTAANLRRLTSGKWRRSVAKWKHEKESSTGRRLTMVTAAPIQRGSNSSSGLLLPACRERPSRVFQVRFANRSVRYSSQSVSHLDSVAEQSSEQIVLDRCGQSEPLPFEAVYSKSRLPHLRKIGEGVFGEVFMYRASPKNSVVLKIIPIEGQQLVNGEPQKKFHEILPEIIIAGELSNLRNGRDCNTAGFVRLLRVRYVRGCYPKHLIEQWELFQDNRGTENDDPEEFGPDQRYIVLEQENAGVDLEAFKFRNSAQSLAALQQVALSLAVAEQKLKFEHRDLHWGNILIAPTDQQNLTFLLNGKSIIVPSNGVKVTIIDYTLSRMVYNNQVLHNDLAKDEELFSADGDYQFTIYRLMRDRLGNDWTRFNPFTNVLWLHYVVDKLIDGARYQTTRTRVHCHSMDKLMEIRDQFLDHKSATSLSMMLQNILQPQLILNIF